MKNIHIVLLDHTPELKDKGVSILGSFDWLKSQEKVYGPHFKLLVAKNKQGDCIAWHPLWTDNRKYFRRIATLPLQPWGGPYFKKIESPLFKKQLHLKEQIQEEFWKYLSTHFERITLCPEDKMIRAYRDAEISTSHTLIKKINSENNWPSDTKRFLKKAMDLGIKVSTETKLSKSEFEKIYNDVFKRKNLTLHFAIEAYQLWIQKENVILKKFTLINSNNDPIGLFAWVEDIPQKKATLILSSILNKELKSGAQYLIYDFIINKLPVGFSFDLAGADDIGVSYFKEHFADKLTHRFIIQGYGGRPLQKKILQLLKK